MPDHWHGLVQLGESRGLSWLMQRAKAAATREVAATFGIGALWQPGFHDRALRKEESVRVAARYVVANPLRAGLASALDGYPFWGSLWGADSLADPFD